MTREQAFRRLFHTFGASFVGYYLLPAEPPWFALLWKLVAVGLFSVAAMIEIARLGGWIGRRDLVGLREYERRRPAAYLYFGAAALPLILFAPEQVTVPAILCASIGDPLVGETRLHVGPWAGAAVGGAAATAFFVIAALPIWIAVLAGIAFVAAESYKNPWLDDDFLTLAVPAFVLIALSLGGWYTPVDIITPVTIPWL